MYIGRSFLTLAVFPALLLSREQGVISLPSSEDVTLYVDGTELVDYSSGEVREGELFTLNDLEWGTYALRLVKHGCEPFDTTVVLDPEHPAAQLDLPAFVPSPGSLIMWGGTIPAFLSVVIAGQAYRQTVLPGHRLEMTLPDGTYPLVIAPLGYSTYRDTVVVQGSSPVIKAVQLRQMDRRQALRESLIYPGKGQRAAGRLRKAKAFQFSASAALMWLGTAEFLVQVNLWDLSRIRERHPNLSGDQLYELVPRADNARDSARFYRRQSLLALAVSAGIYSLNLLDIILFFPR